MTYNEIIKALEEWIKNYEGTYGNFKTLGNALDLITRQQAEIDDLERIVGLMNKRKYYRKFVDEVFRKQKGKKLSEPDFDYIYQLYFEQQAEIERLKEKQEKCFYCTEQANKKISEIKAEAVKEFAERLKDIFEHAYQFEYGYLLTKDVINTKIDNLVKEMVGDN